MVTTTSALFAVPEPLGMVDVKAVSEAARSATLAQNRAGATRLEAAHVLVEQLARRNEAEAGTEGADESNAAAGASRRPAYARLDPQAQARDHLVSACQLTCWHAARLVTAGVQIHRRLPRLRSTVDRGLVPEQLAIDIACRLADVPDSIVSDVEDEVVARISEDLDGGDRPSRAAVDSLFDEALERHDPTAAEDAAAAALEARTVRFRRARDGMATMWAKLSATDAEFLRRRIDADATAASQDGLPGTLDQLRADALAALAVYGPAGQTAGHTAGQPSATTGAEGAETDDDAIELGDVALGADLPRPTLGNAASAGQRIRINVIAAASRGLPNRVEFVHGTYSSFEWLCHELLQGDDASVRFETLDPAPGSLDSPEHALRYVITPAMAARIRLRDGTCRHPGCSVAASDCDVDHVIAFNKRDPELGGPTTEWNLVCLCRKHHREKTFGHNAYRPGPLGELIIITDTGHQHRTRPKGPLARARDDIREREWDAYADRFIADDGLLTNPPGADRRRPTA
ncbi:HNH endonuclease signature motif containing protein [Rhodococcus sp. IEGM 1408]|uniref:HNH endonuclease signature motif containing protein n=1 Tax=Rhodococcus sp. IEGM 1408 TaxID=3082220 RepID=UPI0029536096|nr:HNH endonuclease signature motif containing protein [Rhodococcus sp. IEGM 1408]MDV8001998.1 HNH endonuclease signature motif containing protein [Rhodococcus sp. IEGM 1408]